MSYGVFCKRCGRRTWVKYAHQKINPLCPVCKRASAVDGYIEKEFMEGKYSQIDFNPLG